ncbi:uncharacterized protein LOC144130053 [Amblyomma americanum]
MERAIGVLKSRFRSLQTYRRLQYEPERAAFIIGACSALQNLCLDEPLTEEEDVDATDPDDNEPPPVAVYTQGAAGRLTYLRWRAVRNGFVELFRRTRLQRLTCLRTVRRQLRRQLQRRQH